MQPGYSWWDVYGSKLLCVAEKRKRDNIMQVIIACPEDISFSDPKIACGPAGGVFMGQDIMKARASISKKLDGGGSVEIPSAFLNVLLKTVEEFSFDEDLLRKDPKIFVCQVIVTPNKYEGGACSHENDPFCGHPK